MSGERPVSIGPAEYAAWRKSRLGMLTEQIEQAVVLRLASPLEGRRVLDVGCGDGTLAVAMAQRGAAVTGVDADPAMLVAAGQRAEAAGARLTLHEGRAEQLPFADASFDVVVAVTVLCLVRAPGDVVREAARVLRPGGRLVLGELGRWSLWTARRRIRAWFGSKLWQKAHFRGPAALRRLAAGAGLTVECIEGAVFYPPITGLARLIAPRDRRIGARMLFGAAFLALAAKRP